jgi:hypothetical protein
MMPILCQRASAKEFATRGRDVKQEAAVAGPSQFHERRLTRGLLWRRPFSTAARHVALDPKHLCGV